MSKFRRFAAVFIIAEILMMAVFNLVIVKNYSGISEKEYRVDISRITSRLEKGESLSGIDLSEYPNISAVHIYDETENYRNEYEIRKLGNEIYLFEYLKNDNRLFFYENILMITVITVNAILLIYLDRKIITPFSKMESMTAELAKGNLATPLKQERSRYFKKYLWGMDMLREKLESDRQREQELLKEKKTLILSLSHDIKTPLSAIDLYVKALKRNLYKTDEEKSRVFAGIEDNVSEINKYMQEITDASREEIMVLETNNSEVYLSSVIEKIKIHYCEKMKNHHVNFSVEDTELSMVYGDEDRITEVMQNVIENALKYGDGKDISVSFDEEEGCSLVTVTNSGCTLPKDETTHLFDSFYRGSNVTTQQGSGLGLYICRELMKKMDGEIFVDLKDDNFSITIVLRKI